MEVLNLIQRYSELRDLVDTKQAEVSSVKDELDRTEAALWDWWHSLPEDQRPTTQAAGKYGKITFQVRRTWSVKDPEAFEKWRIENAVAWETFYKLNQSSVGKFCRELENIPQGVDSYELETISFRRT